MDKMKVPVVLSSDHNYIMPTGVAIQSLLDVSKDVICDIYILQSSDVTEEDRDKLRMIVDGNDALLSFVKVDNEIMNNGFVIRNISTAAYYRLLIPWLIPQYDKICYVDGDVIFRQSISFLYNQDIGDFYIAAVSPFEFSPGSFCTYPPKLGCAPEEYINSGVLLFNCKIHRELSLDSVYMSHIGKKYTFQDQDILNIVCKGRIKLLPLKYNVYARFLKEEQDVAILHFAGRNPWKLVVNGWMDWWKVFSRTPFYDETLAYRVINNTANYKYPQSWYIKKLLYYYYPRIYKFLYKTSRL